MITLEIKKLHLLLIFCVAFILFSYKPAKNWVKTLQEKYHDVHTFVDYWYDSDAMKNFQSSYGIPQEVTIAKMWLETHGGLSGAGRRGALFGIKGKGLKGYDNVDKENVEYQAYPTAWQALSHFHKLLQKDLYYERFTAWKKKNYDMPDWYNWLLALQIHPDITKSKLSYAACGCKDGRKPECYKIRKKHAEKGHAFVMKYLR